MTEKRSVVAMGPYGVGVGDVCKYEERADGFTSAGLFCNVLW